MKKQLVLSAAVLLTAGMIFLSGCKKDDTTAPSVTLTGSASMTASLQSSLTDPGATATDDEDGDLTVTSDWSSTNPNLYLKGSYTITYTATDAAGNVGTATRTVDVVNDADAWAGTYLKANIVDSVFGDAAHTNFVQMYAWQNNLIVTASTTVNNKITFDPFSDYSNIAASQMVYGNVTGTTVNIPNQVANCGSPAINHTFQGTGNIVTSSPFKFKISTSDNSSSGTAYDVVYFTK